MASPFSATRWVLFSSVGFRLLSLGGQMLILRYVDKDVFGAYRGLVLIHLMCLTLLPLSIDTLVVREKLRQARYTLAVSVVLGLIGVGLAVASLLLAVVPAPDATSVLARLLSMGGDYPALFLMAPIFLIQAMKLSIRSVHTARLDFRTISIGEFGNGLITWIGGGAVILLFPKSWALMGAYLLGEIFECAWMYRRQPMRLAAMMGPRGWRVAGRLLSRHLGYCLFNTANLTFNNIASLLPGVLFVALISKEANADFSVALQLLVLPTMLMAGALWRVAFPSLSGVSESELQRRCLAIISGSAAYIAPSVLWFAAFAPTTIWILGGEKYIASVPPLLHWMALYMFLVSIYTPISSLDMIRDRPDVGLYWNIVYTIGRVIIIYVFAADGLLAVIAGISVFSTAMWIVHIWIYGWLLGAPWGRFLRPVVRYVPAWLVLGGGFVGCIHVTGGHLVYAPLLSVVPGVLYLGIIFHFHPEAAALLRKMLRLGS